MTEPDLRCSSCGAANEAAGRFCVWCGATLAGEQDPLVGTVIAERYEVVDRIGTDAIGIAYRARYQGALVQLKILHGFGQAFTAGFPNAVGLWRSLDHPGVVRLIDAGETRILSNLALYLVTQHLEGQFLNSHIRVPRLLPLPAALALIDQLLDSLQRAHDSGTLHLDLRPESVFLVMDKSGVSRPQLINFGIGALAAAVTPRLSVLGSSLGTPLYRAPELQRGEPGDPCTDLYAVGAILYELLTGTPVHSSLSALSLARMQTEDEPEPPSKRAPDRSISPEIDAFVLQSLRRRPAARFSTAREMKAALLAVQGSASSRQSISPTVHSPTQGSRGGQALAGRRSELALLLNAATTWTVDGGGKVAIVRGPAGFGKTRLIDALIEELRGGPAAIVRIEGRLSSGTPFEPLSESARELLDVSRNASNERVTRIAQPACASIGLSNEDTVRLLDRLLARPTSLRLGADVVEREETSSVQAFFSRVTSTPNTLVVVEDADLLDPQSSRYLLNLMKTSATRSLSVIATARAEPWPDWHAPHVSRLTLPALDTPAIRQVIAERLGPEVVTTGLLADAVSWTEGSPLLTTLFTRAAEAACSGQGVDRARLAAILQGGVQAIVGLLLRAQTTEARAWLRGGALADFRVPAALLENWSPSSGRTRETLRACAASGIAQINGDCLLYPNREIRDAVREQVSPQDQKDTHRFFATWHERADNGRASPETIAAHWQAAGEARLAADTFAQSATDLEAREEFAAAASLWKRASGAYWQAGLMADAKRCRLAQAEALMATGDVGSVGAVLERMEGVDDPAVSRLRSRMLALVEWKQGDLDRAERILSKASEAAVDALAPEGWFEIESDLTKLYSEMDRLEDAERHATLAHELAMSQADACGPYCGNSPTKQVTRAARTLASLRISLGRGHAARDVLETTLEADAVRGDDGATATLLSELALLPLPDGSPSRTSDVGERALELALKVGDRKLAAKISIDLGSHYLRVGDRSLAVRRLETAQVLAQAVGWTEGEENARQEQTRASGTTTHVSRPTRSVRPPPVTGAVVCGSTSAPDVPQDATVIQANENTAAAVITVAAVEPPESAKSNELPTAPIADNSVRAANKDVSQYFYHVDFSDAKPPSPESSRQPPPSRSSRAPQPSFRKQVVLGLSVLGIVVLILTLVALTRSTPSPSAPPVPTTIPAHS